MEGVLFLDPYRFLCDRASSSWYVDGIVVPHIEKTQAFLALLKGVELCEVGNRFWGTPVGTNVMRGTC